MSATAEQGLGAIPLQGTAMWPIAITENPAPVSDERRSEILADPGFGRYFTDHMVTAQWTAGSG